MVAALLRCAPQRACHAGLNYGGGQSVWDSGEIDALRFALNKSEKAGDFVVFDVGANHGAYVDAALRRSMADCWGLFF